MVRASRLLLADRHSIFPLFQNLESFRSHKKRHRRFKGKESTDPRPALGVDLSVERPDDRIEAGRGAENESRVGSLQNQVSTSDQNLSGSRNNSIQTRKEESETRPT